MTSPFTVRTTGTVSIHTSRRTIQVRDCACCCEAALSRCKKHRREELSMRTTHAALLVFVSFSAKPTHQAADQHVLEIRRIVRPELVVPDVAPAVSTALSKASNCAPAGSIVLSATNKHHARLRPLQFSLIQHRQCFMQRVISVCYNNVSDIYGTCVRSTFNVPPSDYRRSNYANLIWAKWRIIADALRVASMALWLDADVLILRNPWSVLKLGPMPSAKGQLYDVRYQSEPPPTPDQAQTCARPRPVCAGCASINGGQLLVRNAQVAMAIYQARPRNLSNTDRLDQDWADAIIHNSTPLAHSNRTGAGQYYSSCALPNSFMAHCWSHRSFARSEAGRKRAAAGRHSAIDFGCSRTTHHFNCVATRCAHLTTYYRATCSIHYPSMLPLPSLTGA
jgi:hypothetical protein